MEDRIYTNTACPLYESNYCRRLNMVKCEVCPAFSSKSQAEQVREDMDEIAALLPYEDLSELFHSDRCALCKGEAKERVCYAMTDLGNAQPERTGRNFLGMKTKIRIGSILPVQVSCCKDCRKKHRMLTYLRLLLPLAAAVVMLVLLSVISIRESLAAINILLPLGIFVLVVGAAVIIALALEKRLYKAYNSETHLNIMEQPHLAKMADMGWFEIQRGRKISQLIFAKGKLKQGLYTR